MNIMGPKANIKGGSFGRSGTGRFGQSPVSFQNKKARKQSTDPTVGMGPNLRTADRSMRRSSYGSRLLSNASTNGGVVSQQTQDLFKKTIDYKAMKGNACDERLAELIKQYNIRMPIKMIEDGKYMIGTRIVMANLQLREVMVRVGGGYREFYEYVKCEDTELRRIQIKMEQTGLTLD